ncbi:MAG: hypothetical protein AB7O59_00025 [Pirellulales bacterium]
MDHLHKQIRRARLRMVLQSLVSRVAWCWFVALSLAAIAIGVGKFLPALEQNQWAAGCLAVALAGGTLAAIVWTWLKRHDALQAAVEIDRRFGLKERVSSMLSLGPQAIESEAGQALARDAARRMETIDVRDQFGVGLDRRALLPLVPAVIAFVLALGVNGREPLAPAAAVKPADAAAVKKSTQALAKKLEEKSKQASEAGLEEADALLKELQGKAKEMADKSTPDRKQTLVALNELVREAEKRREEVAGAAELKQQLSQLKNLDQGPAQKLGHALKTGDLNKAMQELNKLKEQVATEKLEPKEREQLAKQLAAIEETMKKTVEAHQQAQEEVKKQLEQAKKEGNLAQADKLQQQLDKLAKKAPQLEKMSQLAQQLKSASQCMSEGDCQKAADALGKLSEELAGMERDSQELEMLDDALSEFSDAKNSMSCSECEGEGCEACQGNSFRMSEKYSRSDMGRDAGRGAGDRDEQRTDTDFIDSQVKQNVRKGAVVVTGPADGPNRKGQVQQEIKSEFSNAEQQTAEALSGQRLPHDYRNHTKKYFDTLREGK